MKKRATLQTELGIENRRTDTARCRLHIGRRTIMAAALLILAGGLNAQALPDEPEAFVPQYTATPSSVSSSVIEEHALAQQGFAIALASVVLQTHLYFALMQANEVDYARNTCMPLDPQQPSSGAWEVTIPDPTQSSNERASFYYDAACTRLYTTLDQSLTDPSGVISAFYTVDGKPNGSLVTKGGFNDSSLQASGLGTFIGPVGSNVNASLGITCADATDTALDCSGGVVQDFASLNQAIGSVTPLILSFGSSGGLTFKTRQPSAFLSGAMGSLILGYSDSTATDLAIQGGTAYGSNTVSGEAGTFSLFPPPPTDWTTIDSAHDAQFQIHVIDNTTRQLSASISSISSGAPLANATLDQSGTGRITFSDQSQANIVSWVIEDSPTTNDGPVNLNQQGLTGTWYNPLTSGQGIVMQVFPDLNGSGQGLLFGGWFTYATAPSGSYDRQRWYSLQGPVSSSNPTATVGIYAALGGNFNAAPIVGATPMGQATLSFSDCSHGVLSYAFSDGTSRTGNIPLTRLDSNISCSAHGDTGATLGNAALSGAWYDPNTSGQGLLFDVSPGQNTLFAGWYTFAPDGAQISGGASQRWYTLQAPLTTNGSASGLYLTNVPIYTDAGGVFNDPTKPVSAQVGIATVGFNGCNALTLAYSFTGGTNAGQVGSMNLQRGGPTPRGCSF